VGRGGLERQQSCDTGKGTCLPDFLWKGGGGQKSDGSSVLHPDSMYPILDSKHTSTHEHKSDNITRRVDLLIMSGVVNCINCARFET